MIYSVRATGQTTEETRTEAQFNFCFVQEVGGNDKRGPEEEERRRRQGQTQKSWWEDGGGACEELLESPALSNLPSIAVINYLRLGAV